jgi:hypothetical protein
MWPFKSKPEKITLVEQTDCGCEITHTEEVVRRVRSNADREKLDILIALLNVIASEDLDAMFVAILTEAHASGYNLQDEPQALLERLKRRCHA